MKEIKQNYNSKESKRENLFTLLYSLMKNISLIGPQIKMIARGFLHIINNKIEEHVHNHTTK
jgi:hypothetical protein